jgi:glutamine synthetase
MMRRKLGALGERGYDFCAGLEVEFHLFKLEKAKLGAGDAGQPGEPPDVSLLNQGYQYLTEQRYDEMDPILEILRTNLVDLGLPLRSLEVEFGPSQVEFTFRAGTASIRPTRWCCSAAPPSRSRSATASTPPSCAGRSSPNMMSSGWHLHQSLTDAEDNANAFADASAPLSTTGRHYMAGLLEHARACAAFSTPTSTATSATAPSRWRPTARSGAATIAV